MVGGVGLVWRVEEAKGGRSGLGVLTLPLQLRDPKIFTARRSTSLCSGLPKPGRYGTW